MESKHLLEDKYAQAIITYKSNNGNYVLFNEYDYRYLIRCTGCGKDRKYNSPFLVTKDGCYCPTCQREIGRRKNEESNR